MKRIWNEKKLQIKKSLQIKFDLNQDIKMEIFFYISQTCKIGLQSNFSEFIRLNKLYIYIYKDLNK